MITFNHGQFIRQAIESILMQQCDFSYEIVIGEDCSSDETGTICDEYESSHARVIKLSSETNLGMVQNFFRTLKACSGKYIAICEGDDFWIDDHKLKNQVDLLEKNPEVSLVYSDIITVDNNGRPILNEHLESVRQRYKSGYIFTDLLAGNFINTCTAVFRREQLPSGIQDAARYWFGYDYWVWLRIAAQGKIQFIDKATSAYRIHDCNVSQSINFKDKRRSFYLYYDVIEEFSRTDSGILTAAERRIILRKLISLFRQLHGTIRQKLKIMGIIGKYLPGAIRYTAICQGKTGIKKNVINTQ